MSNTIERVIEKYQTQIRQAKEQLEAAQQTLEIESKRAVELHGETVVTDDLFCDHPLKLAMFKVAMIESRLREAERWLDLSLLAQAQKASAAKTADE
jgi:hypothetical protein